MNGTISAQFAQFGRFGPDDNTPDDEAPYNEAPVDKASVDEATNDEVTEFEALDSHATINHSTRRRPQRILIPVWHRFKLREPMSYNPFHTRNKG